MISSVHASVAIHSSAIVDEGATIGAGSRIWHWVHICSGAVIGERCSFGQNVFVGSRVRVGNNVKIQNNVSVYDNVTLEDDVFCGPSMVFTNVYNPRSAVSRKDEYLDTLVERGRPLGPIARSCAEYASAVMPLSVPVQSVNRSVKSFALMVGVPARQMGWMSAYGERVDLPLEG